MESAEIAGPLLASLRTALGDSGLDYQDIPQIISGGNENDIYSFRLRAAPPPFNQPLVLRLFRAKATAERARKEAAVHQAVTDQGLAAPRVLHVGSGLNGLGRSFLVMEHAPGRATLDLLRPSLLLRLPALHAQTMIALHRLDAGALLAAAQAAGLDRGSVVMDLNVERRERAEANRFPSLGKVGVWLDTHRPEVDPSVIAHGDLHPFNLMIDRGRVSAILDWTRAVIAPPEYDIAANRLIVSYGPVVGKGILGALVPLYRRWFLPRFEALYRAELPFDEMLVRYFEVQMAFEVLTNVALLRRAVAEKAAVLPEKSKESRAFDGPNLPPMMRRVRKLTGVRVVLPALAPGRGRS